MQSRATNLALTHCPQPLMCRERAEQWAVEYARACLSDFKSILADAQVHALARLFLGTWCDLPFAGKENNVQAQTGPSSHVRRAFLH
jgi:hypothetical protein